MLKKGQKAPDFRASTHTGEEVQLSGIDANLIILYFYPKDRTPGCTLQAKGVRDNQDFFDEKNIKIFGISRDKLKDHLKFVQECNLNFPLIVDDSKTICRLYDVLEQRSMFGKKYEGVSRTTYIINPKTMEIKSVIEKVNPITHIDEVKQLVSEISNN